jgi:cell division transport system ATP-binding protein
MISLSEVTKVYGTGTAALSDINLHIEKGEFVFLVGPSGSGKSTLLRMLIRDMVPTKGTIIVNEWDIVKLPNKKIPDLRKRIGVVFQDLKLLTDRTIFENIILPLEMANVARHEAEQRVHEIMGQVGIAEHKDKFPVQLSGGELQRAAIARALVFSPDILLADEPTGNLDVATSWEIIKLLQDINKNGTTILMATHNTDIVNSLLKRVVALEKGKLIKDHKPTGESEEKQSDEKITMKTGPARNASPSDADGEVQEEEHKEKTHHKKDK